MSNTPGIGIRGGHDFGRTSWPERIAFDGANDIYLYSISSNVKIQALDHVHVVNYDLDGASPYSMTLQLPVMESLPGKNRCYFFYVTRCHLNDTLTFAPVALSGNSINGVVGNYTFTLGGNKALFMCVGINGNYIIQSFGQLTAAPVAYTPSGISSNLTTLTDLYALNFYADNPNTGFATFLPSGTAYSAFTAFGNTNISSYITPNVAIPTVSSGYGFRCNVAGWYHFAGRFTESLQWDSTGAKLVWADVAVYDSTGAIKYHLKNPNSCGTYFLGNTDYPNTMCSTFLNLALNDYVLFSSSAQGASIVSHAWLAGNVTFVYYGPTLVGGGGGAPALMSIDGGVPALLSSDMALEDIPPPAPALLRSLGVAVPSDVQDPADPPEIVMGSAEDTHQHRKKIHAEHIKKKEEMAARAQSAKRSRQDFMGGMDGGSGSVSSQPSMSLSDVESIVRQVLKQQQAQQPQQSVQVACDSVASAPPPKKRSRHSSAASQPSPASSGDGSGEVEM